jgi:CHAT domain-containing protein
VSRLVVLLGVVASACQTASPIDNVEAPTVARTEIAATTPPAAPPPTIDDILQSLHAQGRIVPLEVSPTVADVPPPDTTDRQTLTRFYFTRSIAALRAGRFGQQIDDLLTATDYADSRTSPPLFFIWNELANVERKAGNFSAHIDYVHKAIATVPDDERGWRVTLHSKLSMALSAIGRLDAADTALATAASIVPDASMSAASHAQLLVARAALAEAVGEYAAAEAGYRRAIASLARDARYGRHGSHPGLDEFRYFLVRTLIRQGRLLEAESEARQASIDALWKEGRQSRHTPWILRGLVWVLLEQGRYEDAERLAREALRIYDVIGMTSGSAYRAAGHAQLAVALAAQQRDDEALAEYRASDAGLGQDPSLVEYLLGDIRDYVDVLLRTRHVDRAIEILRAMIARRQTVGGDDDRVTVELRGHLGRAYAAQGDLAGALRLFREAIPHLLSHPATDDDDATLPRRGEQRLVAILRAYIDLLADIRGTRFEREAGVDAVADAFRLADVVRWRSVQRAVNASAARAATHSPGLADLVRTEQDTRRQIAALYRLLGPMLSRPIAQQDHEAIAHLQRRIELQRHVLGAFTARVEREFPAYAELRQPKPVSLSDARAALRRDEALVTTLVHRDRTFVWAVPKQGPPAFAVVSMTADALENTVAALRRALDPAVTSLGEIPAFDVAAAHGLYAALLEPVRSGWHHARSLLIVADAALSELPLAVLPTSPVTPRRESGVTFAGYRDVPWLIRTHAITVLPSVAALATLRALPAASPHRRAFVGFGDPRFSAAQAAPVTVGVHGRDAAPAPVATGAAPLALRRSPRGAGTRRISDLPALPDTADEILSLAETMKADRRRDVFLGARATEQAVKALDLTGYRVLAFATHGLLPGDVADLAQPALALSAPELTGTEGDGLLTMEEILSLRLDADWIILSACSSASGITRGGEALSGLGRAFVYAGARALLVSHWPVETTSARALTTDLFHRQRTDPGLSRAEALRQTMNWLLDDGQVIDTPSGDVIFSYGHPIFWAPFTLIGDGR